MQVTAEGVETEQQAALLAALGCDKAQGYFYSLAVSSARIREIVAGFRTGRARAA